jgi:DNA recombination protein RmuC
MRQHGESFAKQNKEQIDGILMPLRDRLVEFQDRIGHFQVETVAAREALKEQIPRP